MKKFPSPEKTSAFEIIRAFVCAIALVATPFHDAAHAQDTRKEEACCRWTLHPPVVGMPCPSHLLSVDVPKSLVFGTFPLSKTQAPVVDGDTIRIEGLKDSVRFVGLDAEETFKDPAKRRLAETNWAEYVRTETAACTPERPRKYATFMGEAAKDAMRQLLDGVTEVRLEWDDLDRKIDTFGRNLVFVLFQKNGTWINLNVEMVRQGLSPYFIKYGRTVRMNDLFEQAQKEARAHERGIWSNPGRFRHYPDYVERLKWWKERADAVVAAEALRADRPDLFILGREDDWERLKTMAGKKVTVFGVAGEPIKKNDVTLLPFGHRRGQDFMVVGTDAEIAKLDPKKEDGNLLYVSGIVEIYKDAPQFRATTVKWARQPRSGAESAPAAR